MTAPSRPPVILMEFNELCPDLLDRWIGERRLPNFARLQAMSDVFVTDADVTDPAQLEPWIQWYSAHTGLAYDQHRVFHLTDGAGAGHDDIFKLMIDAGHRVGSFASMNLAPFRAKGSFYVADPWSERRDAYPPELNVYNRFVSRQVREYSNAQAATGIGDTARFLAFLATHGLAPSTIAMIARQLAAEKAGDARLSYRRAAILDRLQFDVFRAFYRRHRPHLASFFINSTAHFQHSYWRHLDPLAFTIRPDDDEMAVYGDAVRFGYEAMDDLVGRFLRLAAASGATLIFMTALSQQPFLRHEELGGQNFHRLIKADVFLDRLGIRRLAIEPTMTHQYMARFANAADAHAARERLGKLRMKEGRALFDFADRGDATVPSLYFGCQISTRTEPDAVIVDEAGEGNLRFGDHFYRIDAIKSGRHHPEGALWIAGGKGRRHEARVSILDVFPTLVDWFGIPRPRGERRGRSLLPLLEHDEARAA